MCIKRMEVQGWRGTAPSETTLLVIFLAWKTWLYNMSWALKNGGGGGEITSAVDFRLASFPVHSYRRLQCEYRLHAFRVICFLKFLQLQERCLCEPIRRGRLGTRLLPGSSASYSLSLFVLAASAAELRNESCRWSAALISEFWHNL